MVSLERMLFDLNEALHHMGALPQEHYVTASALAYAVLLTFVSVPIQAKVFYWIFKHETVNKYIGEIFVVIPLFIFAIIGQYGILLLSVLLIIFIHIVYSNQKYKSIQDYIDRIF